MNSHSFDLRGLLTRAFAKSAPILAICLAVATLTRSATAQATYTYTGHPFTFFSCGPSADDTATMDCSTPYPNNQNTSYTASDYVSATLTLSSPLPANFTYQDVRTLPGFQLTMNDGQQTLTNAQAVGMFAEVSTDAGGNILNWRFVINTGGALDGGISTINATINGFTSVIDQGTLSCCDPTVPGNLALNFGMPGTWGSGTTPTPAAAVNSLINMLSNPILGLTSGQISRLTDKLNNALLSINAGQYKQAVNQLNAFITSVQSSVKTGKMSTQTANTLTAAANAIIAMLQ